MENYQNVILLPALSILEHTQWQILYVHWWNHEKIRTPPLNISTDVFLTWLVLFSNDARVHKFTVRDCYDSCFNFSLSLLYLLSTRIYSYPYYSFSRHMGFQNRFSHEFSKSYTIRTIYWRRMRECTKFKIRIFVR